MWKMMDNNVLAPNVLGIGVVLVTVSAVAWRVTSRENCAGFFGLTGISGRIPPARQMHPYAAMIYPEFQFRTPPPSYQVIIPILILTHADALLTFEMKVKNFPNF